MASLIQDVPTTLSYLLTSLFSVQLPLDPDVSPPSAGTSPTSFLHSDPSVSLCLLPHGGL